MTAPVSRTYGLKETVFASTEYGDHTIRHYKVETQPTRNDVDEAFTWTPNTGAAKTAILLEDEYPAPSTLNLTETEQGATNKGNFDPGNLIDSGDFNVVHGYKSAALAITSGTSAALPNKDYLDPETFLVFSDSAFTAWVSPKDWTYDSTAGTFDVTASNVSTIYVAALCPKAVVVFETAASVAAADEVFYTYTASQVCNIRGYDDCTAVNVWHSATTESEATGVNAVSDTAVHVLAGYSNPVHEKLYLDTGHDPFIHVHAPVSPTKVAIDVSTVTVAAGQPLYIKTENCTLRRVAIPGAAAELTFTNGYISAELPGNDKTVGISTRGIQTESAALSGAWNWTYRKS